MKAEMPEDMKAFIDSKKAAADARTAEREAKGAGKQMWTGWTLTQATCTEHNKPAR